MCVLDVIILNTGRYLDNVGVLFDLDNNQLKKSDWYIGKCTPRIGTDFIVTANALMIDEIRNDLLALKDFKFRQYEEI